LQSTDPNGSDSDNYGYAKFRKLKYGIEDLT